MLGLGDHTKKSGVEQNVRASTRDLPVRSPQECVQGGTCTAALLCTMDAVDLRAVRENKTSDTFFAVHSPSPTVCSKRLTINFVFAVRISFARFSDTAQVCDVRRRPILDRRYFVLLHICVLYRKSVLSVTATLYMDCLYAIIVF